jgi:hypothetical protein
MKKVLKYIFIVMGCLGVVSCVYPFTPEGVEEEVGLLVMEGDINAGISSTFVPTRSISLTDASQEVSAVELSDIYVESETGAKYGLLEKVESSDNRFLNNRKLSYILDTEKLDEKSKCRLVFAQMARAI